MIGFAIRALRLCVLHLIVSSYHRDLCTAVFHRPGLYQGDQEVNVVGQRGVVQDPCQRSSREGESRFCQQCDADVRVLHAATVRLGWRLMVERFLAGNPRSLQQRVFQGISDGLENRILLAFALFPHQNIRPMEDDIWIDYHGMDSRRLQRPGLDDSYTWFRSQRRVRNAVFPKDVHGSQFHGCVRTGSSVPHGYCILHQRSGAVS